MSLRKTLELSSWIKTMMPSPLLLEAIRTYERFAPMQRENDRISQLQSGLNLTFVLGELASKKVMLKDSGFRQALEEFTPEQVEQYEMIVPLDEAEVPPNAFVDQAQQMRRLIKEIYNDNDRLYVLTGRKFEELIAELMASQGFEVELTKQTRDGGYDILAVQKLMGQYALRFLVECKKYDSSRKVGVGIVREFSHVVAREGANKGLIVTTSYFTKDAVAEAQHPYLLDFRDKDNVLEWVGTYLKK